QIIMISSVTSIGVPPYAAVYGASKATVNALARGLIVELEPDHIWVTTILLGQTHTEFAEKRRGTSGRVAGKLPTMSADFVAQRIVQEVGKRHRSITLRPLDKLINF